MLRKKLLNMIYIALISAAASLLLTGCGGNMLSSDTAPSDTATFVISESIASDSGSNASAASASAAVSSSMQ